ncbi:MAG: UDP-N-acetylmuramate--L-alanine ligase [Bacteroidetes bacterium]|nr:UDP-N-acetylmuramate--L-alanine ligase [Bacteroidota bacterium]
MNELDNISSVYFLGIGGIGMSALARYFHSRGVIVSGYDKTETVLTRQLVAEGISVHYTDDVSLADKNATLVVYTPAIPKDHKEYNYFITGDEYTVMKRSAVLGMITRNTFSICVAGTHGKTTTSSMIAHILRDTGYGCNAFLGGIASNYNTNFWAQSKEAGGAGDKNVSVAEADEYDRSFLQLNPDIAVVTSMDPDHLDIYGTAENLQDAFIEFTSRVKQGGTLVYKYGLKRSNEFKAAKLTSYSLADTAADAFAENIKTDNGSYVFDITVSGEKLENVVLNMGGMHNIENAVAAVAIAKQLKIEDEKIRRALASFKGVKRRFEYVIKEKELVMIDDYAHHPEELRALINGAKNLFPAKKCTVVFQPHLYSRTNDFADGFADVLSIADEVILLPIYPARELPMKGVESEMIMQRMKNKQVRIVPKQDLPAVIKNSRPELLIMSGAGDIDTLVEPVKEILIK